MLFSRGPIFDRFEKERKERGRRKKGRKEGRRRKEGSSIMGGMIEGRKIIFL
jgi:hypothetical protein